MNFMCYDTRGVWPGVQTSASLALFVCCCLARWWARAGEWVYVLPRGSAVQHRSEAKAVLEDAQERVTLLRMSSAVPSLSVATLDDEAPSPPPSSSPPGHSVFPLAKRPDTSFLCSSGKIPVSVDHRYLVLRSFTFSLPLAWPTTSVDSIPSRFSALGFVGYHLSSITQHLSHGLRMDVGDRVVPLYVTGIAHSGLRVHLLYSNSMMTSPPEEAAAPSLVSRPLEENMVLHDEHVRDTVAIKQACWRLLQHTLILESLMLLLLRLGRLSS